MGSSSKSNGYQGKGRISVTKEVRKGHKEQDGIDPVKFSDQVCEGARYSNPTQSEVAKVVVDIECFINQKVTSEALGRVSKMEARFCEGGPYASAQEDEGNVGYVRQSTQEVFGEGGTKGNVGYGRENPLEGSEVSVSKEARKAILERRTSGFQVLEGGMSSKKREGKGPLNHYVVQGVSVDDGDVGLVSSGELSPLLLGVDGANEKSRSNSPPRRRKKKGLSELGDSCPHPRRSVRLSLILPQAGSLEHHKDGLSSVSMSDRDIKICNSRLCAFVNLAEPSSLWVAGKQVGITCRGEEEEVVKEYGRMEDRDSKVALGSKVGVKNVS